MIYNVESKKTPRNPMEISMAEHSATVLVPELCAIKKVLFLNNF